MAISILMYRKGLSLVPADQLAEDDLAKLGTKKPVMVDVRQPRSLPMHRLLFALLRKVCENCEGVSENALLSWLKVQLGHVDYMPLGLGRSYAAPASISFASMDQGAFQVFFDGAVDLICEQIIPGLDKPALLKEVQELVRMS
jgi:hypothetical protein